MNRNIRTRWAVVIMCAPAIVGLSVGCVAGAFGYDSPTVVGGLAGALAALAWLIPVSLCTRGRQR